MIEPHRETADVAIVGAGAAGVLVASAVLRGLGAAAARHRIVLVGDETEIGRGPAYRTTDVRHRLNVPAGRMSAIVDEPGDFVRWLQAAGEPDTDVGTYAAREAYGRYLADHLARIEAEVGSRVERVADRVLGAAPLAEELELRLAEGAALRATHVVLATGSAAPGCAWAPESLRRDPRFVADPWAPGALDMVDAARDVLVVGSGLTMVDVALTLDRPERTIHAVSRHGLLPRSHAEHPRPAIVPADVPAAGDVDELRAAVLRHVRRTVAEHGDWRPAVDGLRSLTAGLWAGLGASDKARFVALHAREWDVLRHRTAPTVARAIARIRDASRLQVAAVEVVDARPAADGIVVELSDGTRRTVGAVVNGTGPRSVLTHGADPLMDELIEHGLARPGPVDMGLDTDVAGRVLGADGEVRALWAIGALRRGTLWESTALPEIRAQASALAEDLRAGITRPPEPRSPGPRTARPERGTADRYGLTLSTSRAAAATYEHALDLLLGVRDGAGEALEAAVALDPTFGLGHAARAVVAHEEQRPEEVADHLDRARETVQRRGTDRERGFVHAVERLTGHADGAALLAHVEAFPRDALAVSIVVPTIAFAGVAAPRAGQDLVERLGKHYGDDPWYLAQLAFVRQEQSRFDEAEGLSLRALAAQPANGHAVHARTHVFYETGQHDAGLAWIDAWIRDRGPGARHRAHFSWHAALHELALGEDDALRRRYATQLAPAVVGGSRAIIDSASLLWRCHVSGAVTSARPVLDTVPDRWLEHPPTAFAGMHVALALAAADDRDGLGRLSEHASRRTGEAWRAAVAPLCSGLVGVLEHRYGPAVKRLRQASARMAACGGSDAQREVVEDTLLFALTGAGHHADAAHLLRRRLDRRPSPRDRRRLAAATAEARRRPDTAPTAPSRRHAVTATR